jgi:hypothetical protein
MAASSIGLGKSEKKIHRAPGTPAGVGQKPMLRVAPRPAGEKGTRFRVLVANVAGDEIEVTGAMTAQLAHALWQLRGGLDISNWADAEALLDQVLAPVAPEVSPAGKGEVVIPGKRTTVRR